MNTILLILVIVVIVVIVLLLISNKVASEQFMEMEELNDVELYRHTTKPFKPQKNYVVHNGGYPHELCFSFGNGTKDCYYTNSPHPIPQTNELMKIVRSSKYPLGEVRIIKGKASNRSFINNSGSLDLEMAMASYKQHHQNQMEQNGFSMIGPWLYAEPYKIKPTSPYNAVYRKEIEIKNICTILCLVYKRQSSWYFALNGKWVDVREFYSNDNFSVVYIPILELGRFVATETIHGSLIENEVPFQLSTWE